MAFMIEEAQASVYKVVNNVRYYSYTCIDTKVGLKFTLLVQAKWTKLQILNSVPMSAFD